jgi:hypothetical protein
MAVANAKVLKTIMTKLSDENLMNDELETFFLMNFANLTVDDKLDEKKLPVPVKKVEVKVKKVKEPVKKVEVKVKKVKEPVKKVEVKEPREKRAPTQHNIRVRENIAFINARYAVPAKHVFAVAAMMSRIENSEKKDKASALLDAICEANQKYQTVTIKCDCALCGLLESDSDNDTDTDNERYV